MGRQHYVDVVRWLDQSAPPLDPASMRYRAAPAAKDAGDCAGCCFRGQHWSVCKESAASAVRAGMRDCDEHDTVTGREFVYVLVEIDARQLTVEGVGDAAPAPR